MSVNEKNIDQLFRDSLSGYEEAPPVYAWDKLKDDLMIVRKKRRAILYRWAAVAAVFIFAFISGYFYATFNLNEKSNQGVAIFQQDSTKNPISVSTLSDNSYESVIYKDQKTIVGNQTGHSILKKPAEKNDAIPSVTSDKIEKPSERKQEYATANSKTSIASENATSGQATDIANQPEIPVSEIQPEETIIIKEEQIGGEQIKSENNNIQPKQKIYTYEDLLVQNKNQGREKWIIGGGFSPVYSYRNIRIKSEDLPSNVISDENYYDNVESGMYSFAGGIDVGYLIKENMSLQTGVYFSKVGQMNEDIVAFQLPDDKVLFYANTSVGIIPFNPLAMPSQIKEVSMRDTAKNLLYINSNVYQDFEYIEIPLILKYRILNKRLSMNLSGGLSPGIMVGNHAYFQYQDQCYDLDRSGDFYPVIYNSVVGIGLDYSVNKKLKVNLSPTFKYSLQSIRRDHSIEYYPYSFSIFTGISYHF
jgi:hypothetical protein